MNDHDLDSLRLLTHRQHEQRLREAGAERLARGFPRTPDGRHAQLEWPKVRTQRRASAIAPSMQTSWKPGRIGAARLIAFLVRVARAAY